VKYLLDTNTLIYAQKRQGQCLLRIAQHAPETLVWSVISLQELAYGMGKSAYPERTRDYLKALKQLYAVLDFDAACAERAGLLRAQLDLQGTPIGPYDLQLAATALVHGHTVVSRNTREFARVPGLLLEDWYENA
jgi:tRNA(fMet)-specific endonuclease VapC